MQCNSRTQGRACDTKQPQQLSRQTHCTSQSHDLKGCAICLITDGARCCKSARMAVQWLSTQAFNLAALLAATVLSGGCQRFEARYPNWEPTSERVPTVASRDLARTRLSISRQSWAKIKHNYSGGYVYVRAKQVLPEKVHFTVFDVENGAVRSRVLLEGLLADVTTKSVHVTALNESRAARPPFPRVVWQESESTIGRHGEAAPPYSVDQLYEQCEHQVLGAHSDLPARLCFNRRNGVLAHCGFLNADCPGCPAVSIQAVAPRPPIRYVHRANPVRYMCWDAAGLGIAEDATASPARRCRLCPGCGQLLRLVNLIPLCCAWGEPAFWSDESYEDRGGYYDGHERLSPPVALDPSSDFCVDSPASTHAHRLPT
jgi:hypothetical protein